MKIYQLQCLNQDGDLENNGFFLNHEDAEIKKYELDESPENTRYGIKQIILEHEVCQGTSDNKDYAEIALTINNMVHDECENVPHDIGWRIMEKVKDYFA